MVDAAIFADTQAEPRAVYAWLDWLEAQLPYPVYRVTNGSLANWVGSRRPGGGVNIDIPAFMTGTDGRASIAMRGCTRQFKVRPIIRKIRALAHLTRKRSPLHPVVTQLIGISKDEALRVKPSREAWLTNSYPLIERNLTRLHCLEWMAAHGYPTPPRSACTFCPYHSDEEWRNVQADPAAWADAVAMDRKIRDMPGALFRSPLYLHRSLQPLEAVSFAAGPRQADAFNNECEGMCGV